MSQAVTAAKSFVRVSIVSADRRLDVGVPSLLPLVELIPGFARSLGVLDPTIAHAGYALQRADGTLLDPSRSSTAQGVQDGELLTHVAGGLVAEPRIYDDVVEAVIDATAEQHRPWTARDNARTALAVSLTFLGLCAVLLLSAGQAIGVGPYIAGGATIVLLATAAVLGRVGQPEAGHAFGLSAAVFAALGAFLAVPVGDPWTWPVAAAGAAAAIAGGISLALLRPDPQLHLIPVVAGVALAVAGTLAALLPVSALAVFALTLAVAGTLGNGLPWLALSSTRIRVISPQSDAEVFADPAPIDADEIKRRAAAGQRLLLALRIAFGITILVATLVVAASGPTGAALCALAFVGMMFQSRQIQARSGVLVVLLMGAVGLAVTGLVVSAGHPDLRPVLLVLLLGATAVLVTVALLSPRARIRLARLADVAEIVVLASLLPLGVASAGLA